MAGNKNTELRLFGPGNLSYGAGGPGCGSGCPGLKCPAGNAYRERYEHQRRSLVTMVSSGMDGRGALKKERPDLVR